MRHDELNKLLTTLKDGAAENAPEIPPAQIEELRIVINACGNNEPLLLAGFFNLLGGFYAILSGFSAMSKVPHFAIAGYAGILLILDGVYRIARRKAEGLVFSALIAVALGLWLGIANFWGWYPESERALGRIEPWAGLGMAVCCFRSIFTWARISSLPKCKVSKETAVLVRALLASLSTETAKDRPTDFLLTIDDALWIARGFAGGVLCVNVFDGAPAVFNKGAFQIELQGDFQSDKGAPAKFTFGKEVVKGTITKEYYDRFAAWKAAN